MLFNKKIEIFKRRKISDSKISSFYQPLKNKLDEEFLNYLESRNHIFLKLNRVIENLRINNLNSHEILNLSKKYLLKIEFKLSKFSPLS